MNNNHCRFLFVLFKARIIRIASSSASCKKGGIYSYKVEVTFAIDTKNREMEYPSIDEKTVSISPYLTCTSSPGEPSFCAA